MPWPARFTRCLFACAFVALAAGDAVPGAAATQARVLDLPLYEPAHGFTQTPAYQPRKFVLEFEPAGPRLTAAAPAGIKGASAALVHAALTIRPDATGVPALDALDRQFGAVALEPLFPGEVAPEPGSGLEDLTRFYVVHLPEGANLPLALAAYAGGEGVKSAEPVAVMPVTYLPNDPGRVNQFQLGQANDRDSDVYEAWDTFKGDSTVVIAIIDTGVQYNHPDLGGNAAPYTAGNLWTNFAELGGTPGVDDDGNGFVDDYRGWDYVNSVSGPAGEDLNAPDNDPSDYVGHGTFCAGMASARTDNGVGIAGTAFKSKIMALRVGWDDGTPAGGVVDMSWCAQAINYAVAKGALVVNCSWANNNLPALQSAVANAVAKGVTVCVAAGNGSTQSQAANYLSTRGDCVDVASTDASDIKSTFSNFGSWVDVSAAGENVYSTWSNHYTPTYGTGSGTSFSSPFTAGAVALFQGYRRSLGKPPFSATRMLLRLRDTGDNIDALNPTYAGAIGSRLNVNRLLNDPPTSWVDGLGGACSTSPALSDLDGDGDDEVIVGATDGKLLAVGGADGDTIPGFPVALGSSINSNPAVWDVDQDGHPDILVGTNSGKLWAIHGNGTTVAGWPVQLSGGIYGGPAVGEICAAVPGLECAVATDAGDVYVLDHTGAVRPGWPRHVNGVVYATPALYDFDGDGEAEVVVGAYDSTLYMWHGNGTAVAGWPIRLGAEIYSSAAIGDLDGGGADVIVGCFDAKVYGFHADGSPLPGWPVTVSGGVRSSPALADLYNNDGVLEVAVASDGPTVYVIKANGTFAPGWPRGIGGNVVGGVVVGNMDGDAALELAVGASDKNLYAFNADGSDLAGFPRAYEGGITGTPTLGDPDRDGRAELLFGDQSKRVRAVDLGPGTFNASLLPWPTMHGDMLRRGSVSTVPVAVDPSGSGRIGLAFALSPNPSQGAVRIQLARGGDVAAADPDAPVGIRLYTVAGRLARTLTLPAPRGEAATLVWDGLDEAGRVTPSGLYFVQATWGDATAHARLVRLP